MKGNIKGLNLLCPTCHKIYSHEEMAIPNCSFCGCGLVYAVNDIKIFENEEQALKIIRMLFSLEKSKTSFGISDHVHITDYENNLRMAHVIGFIRGVVAGKL